MGEVHSKKLEAWLQAHKVEGREFGIYSSQPHSSVVKAARKGRLATFDSVDADRKVDLPFRESHPQFVKAPEPVVRLPIPSWVSTGYDFNAEVTSVWMFKSEAKALAKRFGKRLKNFS